MLLGIILIAAWTGVVLWVGKLCIRKMNRLGDIK